MDVGCRQCLEIIMTYFDKISDTPDNITTIYTPNEALRQIQGLCHFTLTGERME